MSSDATPKPPVLKLADLKLSFGGPAAGETDVPMGQKPSDSESERQPGDAKVVIVGSGPAGLTAAIYAARANLAPVVIGGLESGGEVMITHRVEDFSGFPAPIRG